jgi:hypothetical protein
MTALAMFLAATVTSICPMSHVHYASYPHVGTGLDGIPWIETSNHSFYAHPFYWGAMPWAKERTVGARIFTTVERRRIHPKVLWIARRQAGTTLVIRGRRLDAPGAFSSTVPRAFGKPPQFPSYLSVPAAGCWRVTVRSGTLSGSVVLAAVDRV